MPILLIFDLDGTLYGYTPEFIALCVRANREVAARLFPRESPERLQNMALRSYQQHRDCFSGYEACATRAGLDWPNLRLRLFREYHEHLFVLVEREMPEYFDPAKRTAKIIARMARGRPDFVFAILSHCCMKGWGKPVLNKLGLLDCLRPSLLFGMEELGFTSKALSQEPVQRVLRRTGLDAETTYFFEDAPENLLPAKDLGVQTVLVLHNKTPPRSRPQHIGRITSTPDDLLLHLETNRPWLRPSGQRPAWFSPRRLALAALQVE